MSNTIGNDLVAIGAGASLLPPELEFVTGPVRGISSGSVLLFKTPFFTPWTPPLGIGILKSYLQNAGIKAQCSDFNTDLQLWNTHHRYFHELQSLEHLSINDGYSKLWWILNAHSLAYVNGATAAECCDLIYKIAPLYAVRCNDRIIQQLIRIIEQFFSRLDSLLDRLDLSGVSVIGTSTYTTSLASSLYVLKRVKQRSPGTTTVMGGGVFADDLALGSDNLETLVREYPFIDHVILGEGERLLLELIRGKLAHKRIISIADVNRATLEISEVPIPDFSDFSIDNYYHLTIEGARSCPFECSFCSETIQWGKYRRKSMESFADQVIEMSGRYGNTSFFMGDSLMNPYIIGFAGELLKKNAKILYDGYLRADKVAADGPRVAQWAKSGLYRVRLGVESASAKVLDAMAKMTTPQVISEALRYLATAGVRTTTYWIVGFPGETESDFEETLDFIREHHKYIYELEAHPFYYYPYGQVGSRLYRSSSLYPDEVTKLVKFKVWEIEDAKPDRYERYERLTRISAIAAELGLNNIYTMESRFDAEERWRLLHPLSLEVYKGTQASQLRKQPSVGGNITKQEAVSSKAGFEAGALGSVICYRVTVNRPVDAPLLQRSLNELIDFSDVLPKRCETGDPSPGTWHGSVISVEAAVPPERQQSAFAELLQRSAPEMQPYSIRVVLMGCQDGSTEMLVMVHRSLVDVPGLVLLVEDLFRIYTQLSYGFQVSLPVIPRSGAQPVEQADSEIDIDEVAKRSETYTRLTASRDRSQIVTASLDIDLTSARVAQQLRREAVSLDQLMLSAITEALRVRFSSAPFRISITVDGRTAGGSRDVPVCPLTYIRPIDSGRLAEVLEKLSGTFKRAESGRSRMEEPKPGSSAFEILINLEFLAPPPWMDDPAWQPHSAFIEWGRVPGYDLEIIPILERGGLLSIMFCADRSQDLALEISQDIGSALKAALERIQRLIDARMFWEREFNSGVPELSIAEIVAKDAAGDKEIRSIVFSVPAELRLILEKLYEKPPETLMLAAYFILLSRLSGQNNLVVIKASAEDGIVEELPFQVQVNWDDHIRDLISRIDEKQCLVRTHSLDACRIVDEILNRANAAPLAQECRVGFAASNSPAPSTDLADLFPEFSNGLSLAFCLEAADGGLMVRLFHRDDRVSGESVEQFAALSQRVLQEMATHPTSTIGGLTLDLHEGVPHVSPLGSETFRFS